MIRSRLLLPVALLAGLFLAVAGTAEAAPVSAFAPLPAHALQPGVHVGFGMAVPIRRPHRRAVPVVRSTGHWEIRGERVWLPGELIGYDVYHRPIYTSGQWVIERRRVWVPDVRRHYYPRRRLAPRGRISVGLHFR